MVQINIKITDQEKQNLSDLNNSPKFAKKSMRNYENINLYDLNL